MTEWEKQKRVILPYLQRADEIEKIDPKVAYYCRLYAVDQGINLDNRHKEADALLSLVLSQLDEAKPRHPLDQEEDKKHCERFALNVFRKAQRKDEEGLIDKDVSKAYYAAFNFLEILKQFGPLGRDIEKLRRFAVYRAAEIKKALDSGSMPPSIMPLQAGSSVPDMGPLSPYDPGYRVGLRVFVSEDGFYPGKSGTIRSLPSTEDGLFGVEMDDGRLLDVYARNLAPDLPRDTLVTFLSPEGIQVDAEVHEIDARYWPPTYALLSGDGGQVHFCTHGSFSLIHTKLLHKTNSSSSRHDTVGTETQCPVLPSMEPEDSTDLGAPQPQGSTCMAQDNVGLRTSQRQTGSGMSISQDSRASTVYNWVSPPNSPGFQPDPVAIEEAKRCAKFANLSLNFDDVENAVNYLTDALKLLTGHVHK